VVSTYNQARYLRDCVNSILNQTATADFEIVIVDDASTDGTDKIIHSFTDTRIRYMRHDTNMGIVATYNDGFATAKGKYIARIDADDRYRPHFLSAVLQVFGKYPDVGLVYGDAALINEWGEIMQDPWEATRSRQVHGGKDCKSNEFLALIEENFVPAPTVIARREAWEHALPIPAWVHRQFPAVDWYINLRMARKHDFYYIARTLADYRLHSQNWHRKVTPDRSFETTVLRILDQIFIEEDRAEEKRRIRRRVYATAYLNFADRYFGSQMDVDFRRCYLKALSYRPDYIFKPEQLRKIIAIYLGRDIYQACKKLYRSICGKRSLLDR